MSRLSVFYHPQVLRFIPVGRRSRDTGDLCPFGRVAVRMRRLLRMGLDPQAVRNHNLAKPINVTARLVPGELRIDGLDNVRIIKKILEK